MSDAHEPPTPHDSTDRTTIWYFITALCIGGAEQTLVDLANNLDPDAYDVTVWTMFATNPLAEDLHPHVTVRSLTTRGRVANGSVVGVTNPIAYVTVPLGFWYAAFTERPDVIQSFLFQPDIIARIAGLVCSATVITSVRTVVNDPPLVQTLLYRLTAPLSDAVVSNSQAGADLAVRRGVPADRVAVVRNGRDVDRFRDARGDAVRDELSIPADAPVVGTVGRLVERKGHFELLEAWVEVQRRFPAARLLLVGDGRDRAALEERARELGCADSVEFLGSRRDVPELLAAMDVFAFPSHYEGLPGAVIEAMAAGLPIVATPVDGTAELLDGYRTGLFVSVEIPEELAWCLTRCLEHPALRASLGEAARNHAVEEFSTDVMVERFDRLYRRLGVAPAHERPRRPATPAAERAG